MRAKFVANSSRLAISGSLPSNLESCSEVSAPFSGRWAGLRLQLYSVGFTGGCGRQEESLCPMVLWRVKGEVEERRGDMTEG